MTKPLAVLKCGCCRYRCDECGAVIGGRKCAMWAFRCLRHSPAWGMNIQGGWTVTICAKCSRKPRPHA